ncbi:unnamed protein product [Nesidiocoris tenuis]|uniref:Uncharacterized protein n=1 Tax=Nesidiocoris tenuis TaxID=355587 RepID=A0A6H5HPY3_9HEMI|nr:unnamed protein product [Nesidiocoris tenuis]
MSRAEGRLQRRSLGGGRGGETELEAWASSTTTTTTTSTTTTAGSRGEPLVARDSHGCQPDGGKFSPPPQLPRHDPNVSMLPFHDIEIADFPYGELHNNIMHIIMITAKSKCLPSIGFHRSFQPVVRKLKLF